MKKLLFLLAFLLVATSALAQSGPPASGSNLAVPGPIGATTSSTGQFTKVCTGTSPCTLPGTTGDASVGNSLGVGIAANGTAGNVLMPMTGHNFLLSVVGSSWNIGIDDGVNPGMLIGPNDGSKVTTGTNTAFGIKSDNIVSSMPRMAFSFQEGPDTALSANESMGTFLVPKAITIENIILDIKGSPTCSVSEQITCFDCGNAAGACTAGQTSTIMSAITIATGATRQTIAEAINVANVAAGEYISCHITAGTCTVSNNSIQMMARPQ